MAEKIEEIKVAVPGSYLLIGPAEACLEYAQKIITALDVDWADIREIKPEDSKGKTNITSIGQIVEAQTFVTLTPLGKNKVLIFTDAASMKQEAANALLKTLEEPPKYAVVILISQTDNLLPTITSRCQKKTFWHKENESSCRWDFDNILKQPFYLQSRLISEIVESELCAEFLQEFEQWARQRLRQEKDKNKAGLIREIINAKRDIRGNLIPRIVLETLILRYMHHV